MQRQTDMKGEPQPEPQEASKPSLDLPDWRPDDVEKIVVEVLEELLRDQEYDEQQVPALTDKICETCIRRLVELRRPYKFIVQATLAQRGAGSMHLTSSSRMCVGADGVVTCVWPEDRLHDQVARGFKAAVQLIPRQADQQRRIVQTGKAAAQTRLMFEELYRHRADDALRRKKPSLQQLLQRVSQQPAEEALDSIINSLAALRVPLVELMAAAGGLLLDAASLLFLWVSVLLPVVIPLVTRAARLFMGLQPQQQLVAAAAAASIPLYFLLRISERLRRLRAALAAAYSRLTAYIAAGAPLALTLLLQVSACLLFGSARVSSCVSAVWVALPLLGSAAFAAANLDLLRGCSAAAAAAERAAQQAAAAHEAPTDTPAAAAAAEEEAEAAIAARTELRMRSLRSLTCWLVMWFVEAALNLLSGRLFGVALLLPKQQQQVQQQQQLVVLAEQQQQQLATAAAAGRYKALPTTLQMARAFKLNEGDTLMLHCLSDFAPLQETLQQQQAAAAASSRSLLHRLGYAAAAAFRASPPATTTSSSSSGSLLGSLSPLAGGRLLLQQVQQQLGVMLSPSMLYIIVTGLRYSPQLLLLLLPSFLLSPLLLLLLRGWPLLGTLACLSWQGTVSSRLYWLSYFWGASVAWNLHALMADHVLLRLLPLQQTRLLLLLWGVQTAAKVLSQIAKLDPPEMPAPMQLLHEPHQATMKGSSSSSNSSSSSSSKRSNSSRKH
ncbi:hypothetical protein Emag_005727 [Eimeria magna]